MKTSAPDLQHRDWLLYSQQRIIQNIDPNISIVIMDTANGGKILRVTNISEESIGKLKFLTNTDHNNNYLYIETFNVYIYGSPTPLNIYGLEEIIMNIFRNSDINSFINGEKVFQPFKDDNFKGDNISLFIDRYTELNPLSPNTAGKIKTYQFDLNPDREVEEEEKA